MDQFQQSDDRNRDRALPPGKAGLARIDAQSPPEARIYYPEEERVHLKEYLRILHRYMWVILAVFTVTVLTTVVWTFTQRPIYTATATVNIERQEPRVIQYEPVSPQRSQHQDYYKTQYEILKSRALARRVVKRSNLAEHPEFQAGRPGWWDTVRSGVSNWLKALGLALPKSPAPVVEAAVEVPSPIVGAIWGRTHIKPVPGTHLVKISFDSHSPGLAAQVANTIADSYMALNLEQRLAAGRYARQFLGQQLEETRRKLEASELRLADFLRQKDIVMLPGAQQDLTAQHLSRLGDALLKARTDRMEKEIRVAQARGLDRDLFPNVLQDPYMVTLKNELLKVEASYRELSEIYKPEYPGMARLRDRIEVLRQHLVQEATQGLEAEYQAAKRREEEIEAALQAEQEKAQQENRHLVQNTLLKREVDTNREIYSSLLQRLKETDITSALTLSNVQVVERAIAPMSSSRPRKGRNLLFGSMVGLVGGVGLAFFFSFMDTKLRSPDEVERALHITTLGSIPALRSIDRGLRPIEDEDGPFALITHKRGQSVVSEFFRQLRTVILFSSPDSPPRSLLFASVQAGEGKTSVTLNTAISFAQLGDEVLVIDADLRCPQLHMLLNIQAKPGLSEFLTGQAELTEILRATEIPGLHAIPAGHLPANPADILTSGRMDSMLQTMTRRFRHVFIDTPPLLGPSDTLILARRVEAVVLVLQGGRTEREEARRAVELLRAIHARLLGAVVNKVDLHDGGTYGYAYYAYPSYYAPQRT